MQTLIKTTLVILTWLPLFACELERDSTLAEPCDVAETDCQQSVLEMVAAERGEPAPPLPKVHLGERPTSSNSQIIRPDTDDWLDRAFTAMRMLPAGKSFSAAESERFEYRAFYHSDTKEISLPKNTSIFPPNRRDAISSLAHELDHYMQDRAVDKAALYQRREQTLDTRASYRALFEGEAMLVGWRVGARLTGLTPEELDWATAIDAMEARYLHTLTMSNVPLAVALDTLPYALGARYIHKVWSQYGRKRVEALFDEYPVGIADWFLDSDQGRPAESVLEPVGCQADPAPSGFVLKGTVSLGVLGALAFLAAADATDLDLASKLRGDALTFYSAEISATDEEPSSSRVATRGLAVWRLVFAEDSAAREFAVGIGALGLYQRYSDRRMLVMASADPTVDPATLLEPRRCD